MASKTGYILSEKEVAKIHATIDKADNKLRMAQEDLASLRSRFPLSPVIDSDASKSST